MALLQRASTSVAQCRTTVRGVPALRAAPVRRAVKVQASQQEQAFEAGKALSLSAGAVSLLMAGNAQAATEVAQLAATDNRIAAIAVLFVPALGWVAFNILGPAFAQLNRMNELSSTGSNSAPAKRSAPKKKRSIGAAVGLGAAASMFIAQQADAASEVAQLAASDNRIAAIAVLFVPAVAWVGFNILGPATNQLDRMNQLASSATPKKAARPAKRR